MDRKAALAKWKKEKPVTLLKTGVSEILRELPDSFRADTGIDSLDFDDEAVVRDAPKLNKVLKALDGKLADKKIAADKSAKTCILTIQKAIRDCLDAAKRSVSRNDGLRKQAAQIVEDVHAQAGRYLKAVSDKKINPTIHKDYHSALLDSRKKLGTLAPGLHDEQVVSADLQGDFALIMDGLNGASDRMLAVMKDAHTPAPKLKTDAEYAAAFKAFDASRAKLPKIANALKAGR